MATAAQPAPDFRSFLETPISWTATEDLDTPWRAESGRNSLTVRLNDFPDCPLYSLLVNGNVVADFDDWPSSWERPVS